MITPTKFHRVSLRSSAQGARKRTERPCKTLAGNRSVTLNKKNNMTGNLCKTQCWSLGILLKLNLLTVILGHSIGRVGNHLKILTLWRGAFTKRHSILSVRQGRSGNFCHSKGHWSPRKTSVNEKQHNTNIRSVRKNIRNVGCVHKDISRP